MKIIDLEQEVQWPSAKQLEKARKELRKRLLDEELERALQREAVDGLAKLLKVDRETLRRLWIRPLMKAGATLEIALSAIAKTQLQPN
jgi:hypothetical protein